jgi:hypothetical protein
MAAQPITIKQEYLSNPELLALLEAHIALLSIINAANNLMGHLLSISGLQHHSITISIARFSTTTGLMGYAALKKLSPTQGEVKSMPEH